MTFLFLLDWMQTNTEIWMNQQMEGVRPGTMQPVSRNQHLVQRRRLVWFCVQFDPQQCGPVDAVDSVRPEVLSQRAFIAIVLGAGARAGAFG